MKNEKMTTIEEKIDGPDLADRLFHDQPRPWTYAGARALCEWLEDQEKELGYEISLSIDAIRSNFAEYRSLGEWVWRFCADELHVEFEDEGVGPVFDLAEGMRAKDEVIRAFIRSHGTLIEFSGGVIISANTLLEIS